MITREKLIIPTYELAAPDPDPIYYDVKNNQNTRGNIYPVPMQNEFRNVVCDHEYDVIRLENDYIRVVVIPELGGRIYEGYDKVKDYHFVYKNNVIKPQLIGMAGAWVSGGLEFNWPQHHRPTTYLPLDSFITTGEDGSETAWMGEYEPMFGMKGMIGVTIWPGRSYVTVKARIYNSTRDTQTFHWWANLAVHSNRDYQLQFPPDIDYITFHYKDTVQRFPVVKGMFARANFGEGRDITWFKNIPSPASFFILNSSYDFMGGYDHGKQRGTVHVADHNISVGKKFFTWGQGDFGSVWHRNLTDHDGDYLEIMTGCYTDNQPDFSFIAPDETKVFEQTWYATGNMADIRNAEKEGAVGFHFENGQLIVHINPTEAFPEALFEVSYDGEKLLEETVELKADEMLERQLSVSDAEPDAAKVCILLKDRYGRMIIDYTWRKPYFENREEPQPHVPSRRPEDIESMDELYLEGLHVEQYRHFYLRAEEYYLEGLRRDPGDCRMNDAMGRLELHRGNYDKALEYCRKAVRRQVARNANPRDGEFYFNYARALALTGDLDEAVRCYRKAAWNYNFKCAGLKEAAKLYCRQGRLEDAGKCVREAEAASDSPELLFIHMYLVLKYTEEQRRGTLSPNAVRESLGTENTESAFKDIVKKAEDYLCKDPLEYEVNAGLYLLLKENGGSAEKYAAVLQSFDGRRDGSSFRHELFARYYEIGAYGELLQLSGILESRDLLSLYYLQYAANQCGEEQCAAEFRSKAAGITPDGCFPLSDNDLQVLRYVSNGADGARADYLAGCLLYGRDNYDGAAEILQTAVRKDENLYQAHRILSTYLYERKNDRTGAMEEIQKAFPGHRTPRFFLEYIMIRRANGIAAADLLSEMDANMDLVERSEELFRLRIDLLNETGRFEEASAVMDNREFHPYEGGEGVLVKAYLLCHLSLGCRAMNAGDFETAEREFRRAEKYPENFHEGKMLSAREGSLYYAEGVLSELKNEPEKARALYERAAAVVTGAGDDSDYYTALALRKLGRSVEASGLLNAMKQDAENVLAEEDSMPYFGGFISNLPTEHGIRIANHMKAHPERFYALLGLGNMAEAEREYRNAEQWNCRMGWLDLVKNILK